MIFNYINIDKIVNKFYVLYAVYKLHIYIRL